MEEQELIKIQNGSVKLENAVKYSIEIEVLYQGPDMENPEYIEYMKKNTKENNKIPKMITPPPEVVIEESSRPLTFKLIDTKD